MDCAEDKPSALAKNLHTLSNFSLDFFRSPKGESLLCVDTPTPEGDPITKSFFKFQGIHVRRGALNRIQYVKS